MLPTGSEAWGDAARRPPESRRNPWIVRLGL